MKIGIVPLGYVDGINRRLSNIGTVLINGQIAKIVGRVSMDSFMIDLTDVEGIRTVTLQVAFLPLVVVAVIVQVPFAIAFTTPVEDTVATFVLLDFQVTLSVVVEGDIVALSV